MAFGLRTLTPYDAVGGWSDDDRGSPKVVTTPQKIEFGNSALSLESLIGGLEHEVDYDFPIKIGNVIIPTDFKSIIFQRGRPTTNQIRFYNVPKLQCGAPKIAKLVYNSNNYGLWYLEL